eukprot:scaffold3046_cov105-Cylindrotheca_fusiformis.AAC.26
MGNFQNCKLSLAPTDQLSKLCGFEAGCIPPGFLTPAPVVTFLDEALLELPEKVDFVIGGGGAPNQSTVLPLQTLLDSIPNIYTSSFRLETTSSNMATTPAISSTTIPPTRMQMVTTTREEKQRVFRPFFCVEPPDTKIALEILKGSTITISAKNTLTPESFSIVGRVSGVRQVARRLVFADFAPPLLDDHHHNCNGDNDQQQDWHPWRNPRNRDEDMAVQLVLGKTIMERLGEEAGEAALRRLKRGQLILVKGTTNVDRTDSLINWTSKRSLDVRVSEYQILQTANDGGDGSGDFSGQHQTQSHRGPKKHLKNSSKMPSRPPTIDLEILRLSDIYKDATLERTVVVIDTQQSVDAMHDAILDWLNSNPNKIGLVGIDCEWKPSFLAAANEAQPVLLMQVCFHPTKRIYLLDLQTLLQEEPLMPQDSQSAALEGSVSRLVELLFSVERLVKTGFKVMNDFQRLAASYPHVLAFRLVNTVLEVSRTGMRVLQLSKQARMNKATSSLSKMTEFFLLKSLNKEQQVSDWSIRPMTPAQIEYASLDAAVTPYLTEHMLHQVGATINQDPRIGRWDNDTAFADALKSWKFIVLNQRVDGNTIRKLNAKRVVGLSYVVSQSWISGSEEIPKEPDVPDDENEPYTDACGIVRIPSLTVSIVEDFDNSSRIEFLVGKRIAKSKDDCLFEVLKGNRLLQQPNHKLDFPQRSGYVEFANGVVLFVTMPFRDGQARKYPNKWLKEGSVLSWFVNDHEWGGGESKLATKMVRTVGRPNPIVILFVRKGKEAFVCCGRCHIKHLGDGEEQTRIGNIVMLDLVLRDWDKLRYLPEFQDIL